jgi:hypothetical protein
VVERVKRRNKINILLYCTCYVRALSDKNKPKDGAGIARGSVSSWYWYDLKGDAFLSAGFRLCKTFF